jgi:intein/homing endonuclease
MLMLKSPVEPTFRLSEKFLEQFRGKQPNWGFGNLSYFTYKRTYAREMKDGRQEEFVDTLERVVNGTYRAQEKHCKSNGLTWQALKAQHSAQEMFRRMWEFKFLPPGRGLWMMGTEHVDKIGSAALNNCGFVSTENISVEIGAPFAWSMDMLMLGVGIGFDTRGAGLVKIRKPIRPEIDLSDSMYVIEDSREGWVESTKLLINSYQNGKYIDMDYSPIRGPGLPIKGFGGVSSGPDPLRECHQSIRALLDSLDGQTITSVVIVDIMNFIGKCVVAGNVRRSAELAIGEVTDTDYVTMKDHRLHQVELLDRRWASNNSVFVDQFTDFSGLSENILLNGEPGLIFLDNARHYGRLKDGYITEDDRRYDHVMGFNPCVSSRTWVMTSHGPRQVKDLIDKSNYTLTVNSASYKPLSNGFWKTGYHELFKLETEEGFSLELTKNHKVRLASGEWIEAGDLRSGDQIEIHNHRLAKEWTGIISNADEGYLLGLLVGDGTFANNQAVLSIWEDESGSEAAMKSRVLSAIERFPHRSDFNGFGKVERNFGPFAEYRLRLSALTQLAKTYNIEQGNKIITSRVEMGSPSFYKGFLRGLFDADGSVQGNQMKGCSVRLTQMNKQNLEAAQRMLLRLGIYSTIYKRKEAGITSLPDGKGGQKEYSTSDLFELTVTGEDLVRYRDLVGFEHTAKMNKLNTLIANYQRTPNKTKFICTFKSLISLGFEDVYDITVDEVHAFDANGLYVHNCAEQQLESYELCCLVETFPSNHESMEDYHRTLKFAYLYAKTVTLIPTHDERSNSVVMRNRRIGTSMSGIQQAINKFDRQKFFKKFCDDGYTTIKRWDRIYSRWLGVPESIKVTTVKPSGTVSLLAGVWPGVHFTHAEAYWRLVRLAANSVYVQPLLDAGFRLEFSVNDWKKVQEAWVDSTGTELSDEAAQNLCTKPIDSDRKKMRNVLDWFALKGGTLVVYFPVVEQNYTKSKFDVSIWEQMSTVREMQHFWADNSVSCTITVKENEKSDLLPAIEFAAPYVKTLSFLPLTNHSYAQAPYIEANKNEVLKYAASLGTLDLSTIGNQKIAGSKFCDGDKCEI